MGQALSKNPVRETVIGVSIIGGLCAWLENEVNLPHNSRSSSSSSSSSSPSFDEKNKKVELDFLKDKPSGMTRNNLSFASLNRLERLQRAVELKRSVPRSYKMAAMSFVKCFIAIGVLDLTMARRSKARFFALHALTNAIVTYKSMKDAAVGIYDPMRGMEGPCNVVPAYMILTLFIYQ
jgi:hypothetical protein